MNIKYISSITWLTEQTEQTILFFSVGEHDRQVEEGSEFDVDVKWVFRHPDYLPRQMNNDIALLKLNSPVKLNKYVQPACLPTTDPPVGTKCYITGSCINYTHRNIMRF